MNNKSTTELLDVLNKTKISELEDFVAENSSKENISSYFSDYLYKSGIKTAEIVRKCQGYISKSYIYELIDGKKKSPNRDIVILLCIAAEMDLKTTRRTLELFNHRPLYPKDERDAIIAIFINNGIYEIAQINDRLFEHQLPQLMNSND